MEFPFNSDLLDTFSRADAANLGPNWTADPPGSGFSSFTISSNQAAGTGFHGNWWNVTEFAENQEAWVTIAAMPTAGSGFRLWSRIAFPGTQQIKCYGLSVDTGNSYIVRYDNTNIVVLQTFFTIWNAGDRAGIRCEGSTISAWRDQGSGFVQVGSNVTDHTYRRGGYIGIQDDNDSSLRLTNFGGGDFERRTTLLPPMISGRGAA